MDQSSSSSSGLVFIASRASNFESFVLTDHCHPVVESRVSNSELFESGHIHLVWYLESSLDIVSVTITSSRSSSWSERTSSSGFPRKGLSADVETFFFGAILSFSWPMSFSVFIKSALKELWGLDGSDGLDGVGVAVVESLEDVAPLWLNEESGDEGLGGSADFEGLEGSEGESISGSFVVLKS